jgi:hypothetical protein
MSYMQRLFTSRKGFFLLLPATLTIMLVAVIISLPERALADGGGAFPTHTPTATLIPLVPTETPLETPFLGFPGTPTSTPGAESGFLKYPLPSEQAAVAQNAPQTSQQSSRSPLLTCWPIGIIVLIALIVAVIWFSSKIRQSSNP